LSYHHHNQITTKITRQCYTISGVANERVADENYPA
jgi:hypothetical protein